VLVGHEDGAVVKVATDFLSREFSLRREINFYEYRIARFIAHRRTNVVDVLDGIGMKSLGKSIWVYVLRWYRSYNAPWSSRKVPTVLFLQTASVSLSPFQ
jgi:hypothetical protein